MTNFHGFSPEGYEGSSERPETIRNEAPADAGGAFEGIVHETLLTPATSDASDHVPEYATPSTPEMPGFVPYTEMRPHSELETRAAERRERVLREIGHLDVPLDASSQATISHYGQALGLAEAQAINIEPSAIAAVNRAIGRLPFVRDIDEHSAGVYASELALAISVRDPRQDRSRLVLTNVHEAIGHGSRGASPPLFKSMARMLFRPNSRPYMEGFQSIRGGRGLEEGFAHIVATEYGRATDTLPAAGNESSSPELPSAGAHGAPESIVQPTTYDDDHLYDDMAKALLVLCEVQPALMEVAIASRYDDTAKIEFGALIDETEPGLYNEMLAVGNSINPHELVAEYEDVLQSALMAANLGYEDVKAICDHGQAVTYIAKKLAEHEQATGHRFKKS